MHFPDELSDLAVLWSRKLDYAINHRGLPETGVELVISCLIGVIEAVKHQSKSQFSGVVVMALPRAEFTGFDIALAIASAQKDILTPSAFQHPLGDAVMLGLISVIG